MSDSNKNSPPWMVPEDGDEHGQKLADEATSQSAEPSDAEEPNPQEEAPDSPDSGEVGDTEGDSAEVKEPDLAEKVEQLQQEVRESKDRMLRVAADFENFRKRARREQQDALVRGREEILKELMAVFDNLERAIDSAGTHDIDPAAAAIIEGVVMVQKQFSDGLGRFGLEQFSSLNQPFDPNFHEAMASVDSNEHEPGMVVQEYQKGYMLGERLLRPSMVVVASAKSKVAPPAEEETDPADEVSATIQVSAAELAAEADENEVETEPEPEGEAEPAVEPEEEPEDSEETPASDDDDTMDESGSKEGSA